MNIGTLTGQIELDDLLSGVLMKVDAKLRAVEDAASSSMSLTAGKMTLAVAAGTALANVLTTIATKAVSFATGIIENSIMAGAELERLAKVSQFLGERLGYSKGFIDDLSASIEKSGITGRESRNAIIQLENAHVDLAKASQLSAAAQNMAVISGRGSSETYGMIIRAITTLNPQMIRNAGFTFTMEKVLADYERTTGKTTATMGMHEKQGLLVNAMLADAADKQGLYDEALKTSAKQLTSASRAWEQVSEEIGTAFIPVTDAATEAWYKLATATRDSAKDSKGAVRQISTEIADALKATIKYTTDLASTLVKQGHDIYEGWKSIPQVYRDWAKELSVVTAGVWALNAAVIALSGSTFVKWLMGGAAISASALGVAAGVGNFYLFKEIVVPSLERSYDAWQRLLNLKPQIMQWMMMKGEPNPQAAGVAPLVSSANPLKNNMQQFSVLPDEAKLASGRAAMAALTAYLEKQQQLQGEVTKAVTDTTDAIRKQGIETEVLNKAFAQTDIAIRTTKEAWGIYKPKIEEQITLGRTLSADLRTYYITMQEGERREIALGGEKLKKLGVSIQEIDALKTLGVSEAEIALKYGITTAALTARIAAMQTNKGLIDELVGLEDKLTLSLADQAQKQRDLVFEQRKAELNPKSSDYAKQVEALDLIRTKSFQLEMTNQETLKANQLSNLSIIATKETETYENMLRNQFNLKTGVMEYSNEAIQKQHDIAIAAQEASIAALGYWQNALSGMVTDTGTAVAQMAADLASLGSGTFGPLDASGNRPGLPWSPYAPTAPQNPSGLSSVVNPAAGVSGNSGPQVVVNANGAFFGASKQQVARTIEDLLASRGKTTNQITTR